MIVVCYKPNFLRLYKKLPRALQEEVKEKIQLFQAEPKHPSLKVHKLQGRLKGSMSFSVNYRFRIVFEFETPKRAVMLAVGDHDVYQ